MNTTTHIDPVCRMTVVEHKAAARHDHAGQTYYFCSQACAEKFRQNPAQFTAQSQPAAGSFWAKLRRSLFGGCCSAAHDEDKPKA